jgi:hypothetical protein
MDDRRSDARPAVRATRKGVVKKGHAKRRVANPATNPDPSGGKLRSNGPRKNLSARCEAFRMPIARGADTIILPR